MDQTQVPLNNLVILRTHNMGDCQRADFTRLSSNDALTKFISMRMKIRLLRMLFLVL
jgi:hypothetical protein